eukprot:961975_1
MSIILVLLQSVLTPAQWILVDQPKMPRADYAMAIGEYNKTMYIMGGWHNNRQLIEYNIEDNALIDYGISFFSIDLWGYSTFYTQVDNLLYILTAPDALNTFNFQTRDLIQNIYTVPVSLSYGSCITSHNNSIYLIGGADTSSNPIDSVQILDLLTAQWLNNAPSLKQARERHSCVIHPNTNELYAIGGFDPISTLSAIESINTMNIAQNTWEHVGDLTIPLTHSRAVLYENIIYVLGGMNGDSGYQSDTMHLIDTSTSQLTVSPHRLSYRISDMAAIVYNEAIYAFGGYGDYPIDTWIKYQLTTQPPSTDDQIIQTTPEATDNPSSQQPSAGPIAMESTPTDHPIIQTSSEPTEKKPIATPSNSTVSSSSPSSQQPSANPTAMKPTAARDAEVNTNQLTTVYNIKIDDEDDLAADVTNYVDVILVAIGLVFLFCVCGGLWFWKRQKQRSNILQREVARYDNDNVQTVTAKKNAFNVKISESQKTTKRPEILKRTSEGVRDNVDDDDDDDDVEGLYVKNVEIQTTTNGNTRTGNTTTANGNTPNICTTAGGVPHTECVCSGCLKVKQCELYQGDGLFYCDDCWNQRTEQ